MIDSRAHAAALFIFARIFHAPSGQIFSIHLAEMQKQEALSAPFLFAGKQKLAAAAIRHYLAPGRSSESPS
jgi:hypothetical protein